MARDGSGNYNLPAGNPVVTGTTITSTWANATMPDVGTALTNSISKDGQTTPTANLPMGGNRHTGVADGNLANQYASINQVQNGSLNKVGSVTNATDAFTGSIAPAIAAYTDGLLVTMTPTVTNTTVSPTLALNGLTVKPIYKEGGVACAIGDIILNVAVLLLYSTQAGGGWILLNPQVITGTRIAATALVPDGALSANIPLKNAADVFTKQLVTGGDAGDPPIQLKSGLPGFQLVNTSAAADAKTWTMFVGLTDLIWRIDNNNGSVNKTFLDVGRSAGSVTSMAFGNATDNPPYNFLGSGLLTAGGSISLTGGATANIGATATPAFKVAATTGGSPFFNITMNGTDVCLIGVNIMTGGGAADLAIRVNNGNLIFSVDNGTTVKMKLSSAGQLSIADSAGALQLAGYLGLPQNLLGGNYTCVLADAGKHIYFTVASTAAIPSNASVPYPVGTSLTFVSKSSGGAVSITINTDTLVFAANNTTGTRTLAAGGMATAIKVEATIWHINGGGLS